LPYANVQVLAQAIERAGSLDPAKVRDEVFGGEFPGTVMGDIKFDEKGLAFTPSLALQWYQGERKPVYPDVGVWKLKWIPH
jgi:branched-chain amino acid transport system substrate-binding protein